MEQPSLAIGMDFANLVKKQRPGAQACPRTTDLENPPELAVKGLRRERGANQFSKWLVSLARELVNSQSNDFLSRAAFPNKQDGNVGRRNLCDDSLQRPHRRTRGAYKEVPVGTVLGDCPSATHDDRILESPTPPRSYLPVGECEDRLLAFDEHGPFHFPYADLEQLG